MFSVFSFNFRNTDGRLGKLVITVETFALWVRFPTEISRFSKLPLSRILLQMLPSDWLRYSLSIRQ